MNVWLFYSQNCNLILKIVIQFAKLPFYFSKIVIPRFKNCNSIRKIVNGIRKLTRKTFILFFKNRYSTHKTIFD